jgi:hypothetical protein
VLVRWQGEFVQIESMLSSGSCRSTSRQSLILMMKSLVCAARACCLMRGAAPDTEDDSSLDAAGRSASERPGRHTFCSHLAMRGAPVRAIQELAGHEDLSTMQRYMHVSPAAIRSAIELLDTPRFEAGRGEMGRWILSRSLRCLDRTS